MKYTTNIVGKHGSEGPSNPLGFLLSAFCILLIFHCFIVMVVDFDFDSRMGWVGLGGTMAHYCITACSEECSLASDLQAQQQGFAFQ